MSGLSLGLLSLGLVATAIGAWFRFMNDVAIEGRRSVLLSLCAVGVVIGGVALAREPGWIGGLLAVSGIVGGLAWIALGLLAAQSKQRPNLMIGEVLPSISAPDHTGSPFAVESLRGHPVLIKLFRGHW
jgi:hypothetical protein